MSRRYVIISPCRDEAKFMRRTLDSVLQQSVLPTRWIIVDDGSSDETPSILAEYAEQYDFIEVIRRNDRGNRALGVGVMEAFYTGWEAINVRDYDYICKLDLDLELPHRYFEILIERMEANPRIGTCSGKPYFYSASGKLVSEACGDETSIGASKFYRVACFLDIGGFVPQVGWDGIDCHRCRMKGWIACSWDEPELRFIHLRPMGSSHRSIWTGRMRAGFGQYFMGTSFTYMTAGAIYRMTRRPFVFGGLAMWGGYVWSILSRKSRYDALEFRRFLHHYQWRCLLTGKRRATHQIHERISRRFLMSRVDDSVITRAQKRRLRSRTDEANQRQAGRMALKSRPRGKKKRRILAIASRGGHWIELLRVLPAFESDELVFVTTDTGHRAEVEGHRFYVVPDASRWKKSALIRSGLYVLWVMLKERPDVVISTGAAPGYFAIRLGRWLRAKTIWLDSIANVNELSMSGQLAGRYADLWLTQWSHLAKPGGPKYAGTVL